MRLAVLFFFLLFLVPMVKAQDGEISINLDKFTEVKAFDGISVNLIKSNENKAVITGANKDKVKFVNDDGILKIRMEINKIFSGYRTFVNLYYSQKLVVIDVNEDARISSDEMISQDVIELKAQEGGEVRIMAEVEQMLIRSVSGGVITATGASDVQDVAINTGGSYNGKEFKTKFTTVNVNAGSSAEIFASDYVKATVKAGGEVLVYGDPAKMDEKTVFGGKVTRM
ncbi:head GIN domain-containing protein [uncultured Eudoraea sp.]|uniref:head GIN domain-containing protein n=1 Tax=uncultured Eudoraea sp. TaxID=1035614 RepID=UPI002603C8ED|nr:head GIN domain-containing protein [uncultured Eudoraea sp.]